MGLFYTVYSEKLRNPGGIAVTTVEAIRDLNEHKQSFEPSHTQHKEAFGWLPPLECRLLLCIASFSAA